MKDEIFQSTLKKNGDESPLRGAYKEKWKRKKYHHNDYPLNPLDKYFAFHFGSSLKLRSLLTMAKAHSISI